MNATASGTAVSASAALCSVSPSSATDPENATTIACSTAVAASTVWVIHSARRPSAMASGARGTTIRHPKTSSDGSDSSGLPRSA